MEGIMLKNSFLFSILKKNISNHIQLKSLGFPDISQWNQSNFVHLSKIIANHINDSNLISEEEKVNIGKTISVATLKRYLKYTNAENIPSKLDARILKTFNKLCLFVGHKNWYAFAIANQQPSKEHRFTIYIKKLVQNALEAEFISYQNLSYDHLDKFYIKGESAYCRIVSSIERSIRKGRIITNRNNPSVFELLSIDIISKTDKEIRVTTKEYWLLQWVDKYTEEPLHTYNYLNDQLYILDKIGDTYKIRINFYDTQNATSFS